MKNKMKPGEDNSQEEAGYSNKISRRTFIKGATVGAVAAAAATAFPGCASVGARAATPDRVAKDGRILIPRINPQDYNYRQNTTDFRTLFSPIKFGPHEFSHRMVKSAAGSATNLQEGLSDELLEYYVNFAKGGVEFIWVEALAELTPPGVLPAGALAFGRRLVEECGRYGAKLGYQWMGFGARIGDWTHAHIHSLQDRGVEMARQVQQMGFVAIEINAAGFNQGAHFLSRRRNTRTDEYGTGSLENRARFVVECIQKIKRACGTGFVVQVLMNAVEENDLLSNHRTLFDPINTWTSPHNTVMTIEEGIEFAKLFEAAGCDSLHLRMGVIELHLAGCNDLYFILNGLEGATGFGHQWNFKRHWQGQLRGNHSGAGMLIDVVERYKKAVRIPCGAVTYMDPAHAPDYFENALAEGKVDFYLMTRALTTELEYVNKLREGRIDEIAPCTRCGHCHIGPNPMNAAHGYCRVNAMTQRVHRKIHISQRGQPTSYELPPIDRVKRVMVVGGGPAGMEAARIAAARGHNVTLYERRRHLGGLLDFAHMVKGPHENLLDFKNYLIKQLEVTRVNVVLGRTVDRAFINAQAPDALILATGGLYDSLRIPGDNSVPIIDYEGFTVADVGDNVIIYGSSFLGFDAALWFMVRNKNVQIVTPSRNEDLNLGQSWHAKRMMTSALYALGLKVWPQASIREIRGGRAHIRTEVGTELILNCDSIVNAADMLPNTSLLEGINVQQTFAIGDCAKPYNIALAIHTGNDAGRNV